LTALATDQSSFSFGLGGFLLVVSLMAFSPLARASEENCNLKAPPRASAISDVHGNFIFMHPRMIASGYTGCQTIWGERGEVFMTVRYAKGVLYALTRFNPEDRKPSMECRYKNEMLETRLSECPSYQRIIEDSVKGWSSDEESQLIPLLTPERDPRRD
jgi:hypothetical protein